LLVEFVAYAFAGLFIVRHLIDPQMPLSRGALFTPIIVFIAALGLSLIEPYDYVIGFKNFLRYLLLFAFYWVLHNYLRTTKQIETGLRYYLLYTVLASVTMIYGILSFGGRRKFGIAGIPFNDLLGTAVIIGSVYFLLTEKKDKSWMMLSSYLLFAILLNQTRGAWLSVILTMIFLVVILIADRKSIPQNLVWIRLTKILAVAVIGLLLVFVAFPTVLDYFTTRFTQVQADAKTLQANSIFSRLLIWSTAWETFRQNPITGVGIDLFPMASHLYYHIPSILFMLYVQGLDPHLLFLTFLCETGIIGAAAFLLLLVWNLRLGYLNFKLAPTLDAKRLALAILGVHFYVFISSFYAGAWFYVQLGFQFMLFLAMNSALYSIRTGEYASH
jgi:O-antigen ligase